MEVMVIKPKSKRVFVHVGCRKGWKNKWWIPERWAEVLDYVSKEYDARITFVGGKDDIAETDKVRFLMKEESFSLVEETKDIQDLIPIMKGSDLLLCTNSGIMWIGCSLGIKTIALSIASPEEWGGAMGVVNIYSKDCRHCNKKKCRKYLKCRETITVQEVKDEVDKILK